MKTYLPLIILLWSVFWFGSCILLKRKGEVPQKIHVRTGEVIATKDLIRNYEKEHQQFNKEETRDGNSLRWPDLENKNLSDYCRKYLQYANPTRKNEGVTGIRIETTLVYEEENRCIKGAVVVVVQCKVVHRKCQISYYMMRAPEPNCVYTLKCRKYTESFKGLIFTIMNKYCDFETRPLINSSLKPKKADVVNHKNHTTGQPIAKNEYVLAYELEHQELLKGQGECGKCIEWPYAMEHHNLNSFCTQYVRACAPRKVFDGIIGSWKIEKLYYQKLNTKTYVNVTAVMCLIPNAVKLRYYITRAPEKNCVYALLRKGHNRHQPLVIIFKHCDFEFTNNRQISILHYDSNKQNKIAKNEVKEETFDNFEMLPFFPKN